MADFLEVFMTYLFTETPEWFIVTVSIIFIVSFVFCNVFLILGIKRLSDNLGREKKIYDLQKEIHELKYNNNLNKDIASNLLTVLNNSRQLIDTLKEFLSKLNNSTTIEMDTSAGYIGMYIQNIIENLAADVKTTAGERHRCGFWLFDDEKEILKLIQGSSGFPGHYIGNRELEYNNSIAGRCLRKKELINRSNVKHDPDYASSESESGYKSLICVPIGKFAVLTLDGYNPLDKNVESIAELYASILETLYESSIGIIKNQTSLNFPKEKEVEDEVAASTSKMEDD